MDEEALASQERKQFDMPELLHNLDLLVDMAESAVIQNDKKWVYSARVIIVLFLCAW